MLWYQDELTELVHLHLQALLTNVSVLTLNLKWHIRDTSVVSEILLAIGSTYNANV